MRSHLQSSSSSILLALSALTLFFTLLTTVVQGQAPLSIAGGWSPWSTISTPCLRTVTGQQPISVTCGGGQQMKVRSCTNPRPQGLDPADCVGSPEVSVPCNTNPCDMQWSPWGNCSSSCGRGNMLRYTMCATEPGGNLTNCKDLGLVNQTFDQVMACNTWNKATCQSPCIGYNCMDYASCVDVSDDTDPKVLCVCQLGRTLDSTGTVCVVPPPATPTPRPIPTLAPAVKAATTAVTNTASTLLIIFTGITLFLFAALRIYDDARVIQMNMEIALISAHILLLCPDTLHENVVACKVVSILLHFFFTACFMFMFLESLHTYSLVAFVVKRHGLFCRWQNVVIGWGVALAVVLIGVGFRYGDYGGQYMCWLMLNTPLLMAQVIPITALVILIFTMIEAAGAAEYRRLPGMDYQQLLSAKIMQRTNLIIMPLCFASYITGILSEYEQSVPLYSIFTILNGVLGGCVFFFHSTGNERVRERLLRAYNLIFKKI